MIDLAAIEARCDGADRLKREHPWTWIEHAEIRAAFKDRAELVVEVKRLQELIPNPALLRRLADYASYDFTNQPPLFEDTRRKLHADAVAARALADKIEEANVDEIRRQRQAPDPGRRGRDIDATQ